MTRGTASWRWKGGPLAASIVVLLGAATMPRAGDVPPRRHAVEIRGMAFHPAVLKLAAGDTVVWHNSDIVPHTATADSSPGWSTGVLARDESGTHVPNRRGTSEYFCELHPGMKGRLIIQ